MTVRMITDCKRIALIMQFGRGFIIPQFSALSPCCRGPEDCSVLVLLELSRNGIRPERTAAAIPFMLWWQIGGEKERRLAWYSAAGAWVRALQGAVEMLTVHCVLFSNWALWHSLSNGRTVLITTRFLLLSWVGAYVDSTFHIPSLQVTVSSPVYCVTFYSTHLTVL
jgi:hypothetical protein